MLAFTLALLIPFVAGCIIWYGLPAIRWIGVGELLLRREMIAEGRFMAWSAVSENLAVGRGTLEYCSAGGNRGFFWYFPESNSTNDDDIYPFLTNCPMKYSRQKRFIRDFPIAKYRAVERGF